MSSPSADLTNRDSKADPSEPFIAPYFISDGKSGAPTFQPPKKRSQRPNTEQAREWYTSLTCSWHDRRCCCCQCSWKCCGIAFVVIVVVIGVILGGGYWYVRSRMTGTASSKDASEWEATLSQTENETSVAAVDVRLAKSILDGDYVLVSYDEKYPEYLSSMGMPGFVVSLVLSSSETVKIRQPDQPGGNWSMITVTDLATRNAYFRVGEPFSMELGMGSQKGLMVSTCELLGAAKNILSCEMEEVTRNMKFKATSVFTKAGFINTRTSLDKDITAKKYYQRTSQLELSDDANSDADAKNVANGDDDVDELNSRILKATQAPNRQEPIFSNDDDDPFENSDWKDDFFDDD